MGIGTAISVGAGLVGSALGAKASNKAAQTQAQSAREAGDREIYMYEQSREDLAPYRETGTASLARLSELMGVGGEEGAEGYGSLARPFSMQDFEQDPGYQFRMSEGMKALERSQAARGGLLSGAAGKEMLRYGQGVASDEYSRAYDRYNLNQQNLYNRLSGLAGTGQSSTAQTAQLGASATGAANRYLTDAAAAQAAGGVGAANAWQQGLQTVGAAAPAIAGYGASRGWWGGYDPNSGITWNSGRVV